MVADAQSVVRSQIGVVDRGCARRTAGGRYMNAGYRADGGSAARWQNSGGCVGRCRQSRIDVWPRGTPGTRGAHEWRAGSIHSASEIAWQTYIKPALRSP